MKVLYENSIDSNTTITPSSEDSNFTFETAFNDKRLTRFGRFTGIASENIVFSKSAGFDLDSVIVANNNISSSATVKFQAHIENVWTSPYLDVTLSRLDNGYYYYEFSTTPTPPNENFYEDLSGDTYADESGNNYTDFSGSAYVYCRILITDPTSSESYIKLSKVYVGLNKSLPGIAPTAELPITSNSVVEQSLSGQVFSDKRTQLKGANVSFPVINETERQTLKTFFATVDKTEPFYLLVWENDLDIEPPLYCTLTSDLEIKKANGISYSADFSFIENK